MILNRIKLELERAVIFIKYIAKVVPLIFSPKTLILNKLVLPVSNSLKVLQLVQNELQKTFSESIYQHLFLASDISRLEVGFLHSRRILPNQTFAKSFSKIYYYLFVWYFQLKINGF